MNPIKPLFVPQPLVNAKFFPRIVFLLLCLMGTGLFKEATGQSEYVVICNKGSIDVAVAVMAIDEGIFIDSMALDGWYTVQPSDCQNVIRAGGYKHIVFGVTGPNNEFGVVKYEFPETGGLHRSRVLDEVCVKAERMDESAYDRRKYPLVPPCPAGFKAAPTSQSLYIMGNARMTLNVRPSIEDAKQYAVLLREGRQPAVPKIDSSKADTSITDSRSILSRNPNSPKKRPTNVGASWALPPLMAGNWMTLGPQASNNLRLKLIRSSLSEMTALGRRIQQFRTRQLSFYPGATLYEGQVPTSGSEPPGVCSFIVLQDGRVMPLNGTGSRIHELNKLAPLALRTIADVESYLRFFTSETFGDKGSFRIVENLDDINWARGTSSSEKTSSTKHLTALSLTKLAKGKWRAAAIVQYSDALFRSVFTVDERGNVEMTEDKALIVGLPIRHEAFTGSVRREVKRGNN